MREKIGDPIVFVIVIVIVYIFCGHNGLLSGFSDGCPRPDTGKNAEEFAKVLDPFAEPVYVETPPRLEFYEQ